MQAGDSAQSAIVIEDSEDSCENDEPEDPRDRDPRYRKSWGGEYALVPPATLKEIPPVLSAPSLAELKNRWGFSSMQRYNYAHAYLKYICEHNDGIMQIDYMHRLREIVYCGVTYIDCSRQITEAVEKPSKGTVYVYSPVKVLRQGNLALFESLVRLQLDNAMTHHKITESMFRKMANLAADEVLCTDVDITDYFSQMGWMSSTLFASTFGRPTAIALNTERLTKHDPKLTAIFRDTEMCIVCLTDQPADNYLCDNCGRGVCTVCLPRVAHSCPTCRKPMIDATGAQAAKAHCCIS